MARSKSRNAKRHKAAHRIQRNDSQCSVRLSESEEEESKLGMVGGLSTGADFIRLADLGDTSNSVFNRRESKASPRAGSKRRYEEDLDSDNEYERVDEHIDVHPWFDLMPDLRIEKPPAFTPLLQREIDCFLQYMEPTVAEYTLRNYLVHKIQHTVHKLNPRATVHVFGSFAMNTYLPNSDMDLVVEGANFSLRTLARALERERICRRPNVIAKAKVPIVKFFDSLTRLQVDISLGPANGIQSAETVRGMIRTQPALRPLVIIVKHFLALQKLNEVFTGGMGGFAIVCMVMAFLQSHPLIANSQIDPLLNLAPLLLDFLQLYGGNFNYERVGIDVAAEQTGQPVFYPLSTASTDKLGRPVFRIRDPDQYDNDLGVKSYRAEYVVKAFKAAYNAMILTGGRVWKQLANMDTIDLKKDGRSLSMMAPIFYIPSEMQSIRKHIQDVYSSREWMKEPEASTFNL